MTLNARSQLEINVAALELLVLALLRLQELIISTLGSIRNKGPGGQIFLFFSEKSNPRVCILFFYTIS